MAGRRYPGVVAQGFRGRRDRVESNTAARRHRRRRTRVHSRRRILLGLLAVVLVVAGVAVAGTAALHDTGRGRAAVQQPNPPNPASSPNPSALGTGALEKAPAMWALAPVPAAAVLSPLDQLPTTGAVPKPAAIAARLAPLLADPVLASDTIALVVTDPRSGTTLLDNHGSDAVAPASTAKLAVAVAALHVLGPDHRLTTSVVLGNAGQVVLVGGGDPTLAGPKAVGVHDPGYPAPARLADLATQTASALKARGVTSVSLGYDASLYGGPSTAPGWKPLYVNEGDVAPVSALEVDEGSPDLAKPARSADPAKLAATEFASLLSADGVPVTGAPAASAASPDAAVLASVQSPRLSALVQRMLGRSDNDLAESLARQVAIATGKPATFAGGADAVRSVVAGLGVSADGFAMADGSGLSTSDRVHAKALVQLVDLVLGPGRPELSSIRQALPVAGFSGTLASRYTKPPASSAAGRVWAKTGTLDGVVALAGYLDDASGRVLAFAVIANGVPLNATLTTESAVDRLTAGLAACGCS